MGDDDDNCGDDDCEQTMMVIRGVDDDGVNGFDGERIDGGDDNGDGHEARIQLASISLKKIVHSLKKFIRLCDYRCRGQVIWSG